MLFLPSLRFRAVLVPSDRVYPGEDIARERAHSATEYLVLAKLFVAAVAADRAYEIVAGCNEKRVVALGIGVSSMALMQATTLREPENVEERACCKQERQSRLLMQISCTEIHFVARPVAVAGTVLSLWSAMPVAVRRDVWRDYWQQLRAPSRRDGAQSQ